MQLVSDCARAWTKLSSAEVSSIRRVKCVVMASRVAMLVSGRVPRVFWMIVRRSSSFPSAPCVV
jgi:hypothetical protein